MSYIALKHENFNSESVLVPMQKRFATWRDDDHLESCDPMVKQCLLHLNKHPDLATVFCCEGHFDDRGNNGYIMFCANAVGTAWLFDLYSALMKKLVDLHSRDPHCDLAFTTDLTFGCNLYPMPRLNDFAYPTICLNVLFHHILLKPLYYRLLEETILELLPKPEGTI